MNTSKVKLLITGLFLVLFYGPLYAQGGIQGVVSDQEGNSISYASIFIEELSRGTTCNALGRFSLPLPPGSYTVHFRSLGYTEVSQEISVEASFTELEIALPPQTYMIPELRISASGEDPAYFIMRKTIGLAHYHLNEVLSYDAEIYMKGTAIADNIPRAIARRVEAEDQNIKIEEGRAYMLESVNQVHFRAPDKYQMEVLATQNTIPGFGETVNPMEYVNASLYQEEIEGVILPMARTAFQHYRYSFEGSFLEGPYFVNKIRVTPRRKSQQLVEGFLYIVEDRWCLYSADLTINTIAGRVRLEQLYANVMMDAWLPVSHKIGVEVDIVGVKARVTYVSSLDYQRVELNPNLPRGYLEDLRTTAQVNEKPEDQAATPATDEPENPAAPPSKESSKNEQKIEELLQKDELNNREVMKLSRLMEKEMAGSGSTERSLQMDQTRTTFSVADSAVNMDSTFWSSTRPIPLTPEESITLEQRDSIRSLTDQARAGGTDSTAGRSSGLSAGGLLMGDSYRSRKGKLSFRHGGLIDFDRLDYNTVDGLVYGQYFRLRWDLDSVNYLSTSLTANWAFQRAAPELSWVTSLRYAPMSRGLFTFTADYGSRDFNGGSGISRLTNMDYTLIMRENYLKLFEELRLSLYNSIDIRNGLTLRTSASYSEAAALENNSDFSFFFNDSKAFSPNLPGSLAAGDPALEDRRSLAAGITLRITPRQPFVIWNYRKYKRQSKWPTLQLNYRQAYAVQTGWSDFVQLSAGLDHVIELGVLSDLHWDLQAGFFPRKVTMHYSQFRHFKSNPLNVDFAGLEQAHVLLDHYEASTNEHWLGGGIRFTTPFLLLKYLPWVSERLWTESLRARWLHTPATPHYIQVGYSLNDIFFIADIGIYAGFQDWSYKGIALRFNFDF